MVVLLVYQKGQNEVRLPVAEPLRLCLHALEVSLFDDLEQLLCLGLGHQHLLRAADSALDPLPGLWVVSSLRLLW